MANSPHHRARQPYWHRHAFYEIGLVLSGRCIWRLGPRRRLELQAGQTILLPPQTLHCEQVQGEEARLAWLGFTAVGSVPPWSRQVVSLGEEMAEISGTFDAITREHHRVDTLSQVRIGLALQTILLLLARQAGESKKNFPRVPSRRTRLNPRQARTVESAAHYFRNNVQQPLSIAQVAAYYSLCPAHFSTLFRQHHRLAPRTFLRQARLQRAADLLTESDLTVKEIAARCGFVDAAHLCKSFKQEHHLTPTLFRTRLSKHEFEVKKEG